MEGANTTGVINFQIQFKLSLATLSNPLFVNILQHVFDKLNSNDSPAYHQPTWLQHDVNLFYVLASLSDAFHSSPSSPL